MFAEQSAIELVFLAAVALIVVGPKDLPVLLRKIGQFTAKMRGLAAEFRASFEELARQSELDELRKEVDALRQGQLGLAPVRQEVEQHFDELHHAINPVPSLSAPLTPWPEAAPDTVPAATDRLVPPLQLAAEAAPAFEIVRIPDPIPAPPVPAEEARG